MPVHGISILLSPETYARLMALQTRPNEAPEHLIDRLLDMRLPAAPLAPPPAQRPRAPAPEQECPPNGRSRHLSYKLLGQTFSAANANSAMIDILKELHGLHPGLFDRLSVDVQGTSRNHLARAREQVYPDRPDHLEYVKQLVPGWWIGTNIANREKRKILEAACGIAGIAYGSDLKIDLPER